MRMSAQIFLWVVGFEFFEALPARIPTRFVVGLWPLGAFSPDSPLFPSELGEITHGARKIIRYKVMSILEVSSSSP